jgi:hypothetical protein
MPVRPTTQPANNPPSVIHKSRGTCRTLLAGLANPGAPRAPALRGWFAGRLT